MINPCKRNLTSVANELQKPKMQAAVSILAITMLATGILALLACRGVDLGHILNHLGKIKPIGAYSFMAAEGFLAFLEIGVWTRQYVIRQKKIEVIRVLRQAVRNPTPTMNRSLEEMAAAQARKEERDLIIASGRSGFVREVAIGSVDRYLNDNKDLDPRIRKFIDNNRPFFHVLLQRLPGHVYNVENSYDVFQSNNQSTKSLSNYFVAVQDPQGKIGEEVSLVILALNREKHQVAIVRSFIIKLIAEGDEQTPLSQGHHDYMQYVQSIETTYNYVPMDELLDLAEREEWYLGQASAQSEEV
ncbi:MAG: hypothetical protein JSS62_03115 [Verrucomicrobia bacterium]|nr:hypothetical protein [Verrucomicrobiota bacterium]MBS0646046.1 hypothetical protein [Verrucomicrobiota bacterium]